MFKTNSEIIRIEAKSMKKIDTGVVFWSHDRGTAKLMFKLVKDSIPQSLPEGTTVPIRLLFKSATAEGGYGKHDYLATIDDRVNGVVSIVLEDNILGYVGIVEGSVYIDFPNNRSLDTAGRFTFSIKRSPIDDSTPELEDYYFNGFSQTIDKIEQMVSNAKAEIGEKVAESETQIDTKLKNTNDKITKANQDVTTINTNIDKANDRIDQTNQQISDLGKFRKMYSNSIDFGDYDYSGNPNISAKLNASSFSLGTGATVADDNDEIVFTLDGKSNLTKYKVGTQVPLNEGKQYTISCEIMLESDFVGDPSGLRLQHAYVDGGVITLATTTVPTLELNTWQKLSGSAIIKYASNTPKQWYTVFRNMISDNPTGKVRLRNIKVEEGSKATPYQPNLLEAPYYLSEAPLGKNIADKSIQFPIKTSAYKIYQGDMLEPFEVGETYTITIGGTKPSQKTFSVYNAGTVLLGNLTPVEGLPNVWSRTFKISTINTTYPNKLQLYQLPNDNDYGACQIDWLKIEKGDTRTPNIQQYKYFGEGLKDSNDLNDYSWDITPDYTEKSLNNTVSLTEPQSIEGTKNFLDDPQVRGEKIHYGPQLFEGFYGSGTVHSNLKNKARVAVGGLVMDGKPRLSEPFEWNTGRWMATVTRDVTFYCKGTMYIDTGGSMGKYIYIANWKDEAQTQYASGNPAGMGIAADNGYWYRNFCDFSFIVSLKKGDKFSIGIELAVDKKVWNIQIRTLHIKELVPPTQ